MTLEIKSFPSAPEFRDWLASHHGQTDGIWLCFFKKTSGEASLTHSEALDEALCYGWIDGQAKAYDERSVASTIQSQASRQFLVQNQYAARRAPD